MEENKRKLEGKMKKSFVGAWLRTCPQKGITLIALIITIIVMLILVGVTINVALNGGVFTQAQTAANDTQIQADKEQLLSAVVGAIGTDAKVDFSKLDSNLPKDWTKVTDKTYKSPKGNVFTVDENGTITEGNENVGGTGETEQPTEGTTLIAMYRAGEDCTVENCIDEGHLHIGDYVEYKPDTKVTTYYPDGEDEDNIGVNTGYTTLEGATRLQTVGQENLNWRVLGASGDNVLLISGAPTTSGIHFHGHTAYNNYENILNTTCSTLYSKAGIGTARSITMKDIDTYLEGSNFDKTSFGGSGILERYGYTNTNITSKFSYDKKTNTLTELAEGTTTLSLASDAYMYIASDYITNPTKLDLVQGSNNNNYYYWIASRSIDVKSHDAHFDVSLVYYGGISTVTRRWLCSSFRLRVQYGVLFTTCG